jgi:peptidyl-prolyl cis-trans isomerase D
VFILLLKNPTTNKMPGDIKQIMSLLHSKTQQFTGLYEELQDNANIKDYRIEVWDKTAQQ